MACFNSLHIVKITIIIKQNMPYCLIARVKIALFICKESLLKGCCL